eukprot:7973382-Pyramimonas_sp.AAC.1
MRRTIQTFIGRASAPLRGGSQRRAPGGPGPRSQGNPPAIVGQGGHGRRPLFPFWHAWARPGRRG